MIDAVVFNGPNVLDFFDVRTNVVRIPEVSARLGQAQRIWDAEGGTSLSLHNLMVADDRLFLSNIKLKSMMAAVVQVGLFDRYLRHQEMPQFLIGNSNGDSAFHVCSGKLPFEEMVLASAALRMDRPMPVLQVAEAPVLAGVSLMEYQVNRRTEDGEYTEIESGIMDINKIAQRLIDEFEVKKFINIGPGNLLLAQLTQRLALSDIQILESIDLEPMLSWFWTGLKRQNYRELLAQ